MAPTDRRVAISSARAHMCATATPPPPCPEGGQGNTGENQTHFPNTAAIDTQAHRRRLDTAATNMQAAVCLSLLLPHLKLFKDLGNIYEKKILEDRSIFPPKEGRVGYSNIQMN